jgi:hypothetical protein
MKLDERILEEIKKYNKINNYIMEQEAPPAEPPMDPAMDMGAEVPPADPAAAPADPAAPAAPEAPAAPVDVESDPDVEPLTDEGEEGDAEELDITDLVDTQKTMADKQEEYFNNLFDQIKNMEQKLAEMDSLVTKLDGIESKLEKYRPKTPQEKLQLRSLDSGPYKQNLADFFDEKKDEMEATGKNEYVLTQADVENFSDADIEKSFTEPIVDEDEILLNKFNS